MKKINFTNNVGTILRPIMIISVISLLMVACGSKSPVDTAIAQVENLLKAAENEKEKWTDNEWAKFNEEFSEPYQILVDAINDDNVSALKKIKISTLMLKYITVAGSHARNFDSAKDESEQEYADEEFEDTSIISDKTEDGENWYSQDFRVNFYYDLGVPGMGASQPATSFFVRKGDIIYEWTEIDGVALCYVTRMENGDYVRYTVNISKKKALREVEKDRLSVEEGFLSRINYLLGDKMSLKPLSSPKNTVTELGTEEIAGIKCNVYKVATSNEEYEKKTKEMEALAKIAGKEGEKLQKMISDTKNSYSQIWVHHEYTKLKMKQFTQFVNINGGGNQVQRVTYEVKELQFGDFDCSDVVLDLTGYAIE